VIVYLLTEHLFSTFINEFINNYLFVSAEVSYDLTDLSLSNIGDLRSKYFSL
jgi:hypothetical protein